MSRDNYFTPTKQIDLEKLAGLAALGLSYAEMAGCLGMSAKTFSRRREESEAVQDAIVAGRGRGVAEVATALKERAVAGDPAACKIFLQALGGNFGKKATITHEGEALGPTLSIRMPLPSGETIDLYEYEAFKRHKQTALIEKE